jgi:hypothetical protein
LEVPKIDCDDSLQLARVLVALKEVEERSTGRLKPGSSRGRKELTAILRLLRLTLIAKV